MPSSGTIRMVYDLDLYAAESPFTRALEINLHSAMAHHYDGLLLICAWPARRRPRLHTTRPGARTPALNFNANIGMIHYYSRRYEERWCSLKHPRHG